MFDEQLSYDEQLDRWHELIAFYRWYPDLFVDLLRPVDKATGKKTGFELGYDQRVLMRGIARSNKNFICVSRGYGKTTIQLLSLYVMCILYPNIQLSVGSTSQQNASSLFTDKHSDLMNMLPMLQNEIASCLISKDKVRIVFKNKSTITSIQVGQGSKGLRKNIVCIEELCQVLKDDASIYFDAIEPLLETTPKSVKNNRPDPYFMNKEIFVTTAWYKNVGYEFNIKTFQKMINLEGGFVFGASYLLPAKLGRGRSEEEIALLEDSVGTTFFNTNYRSRYVSSNGSTIVDIDKLNSLRVIPKPELKATKGGEYVVSCDVARSASDKNNCTTIAVGKIKRDKKEKIKSIIPQREPFLMIDEIEEYIPGESAICYKDVKEEEWYFKGHFPGNPIMPGVLITESLAQAGAIAILSKEENKGKNALFGGINKMKFKKQVVPGDRLKLEVKIIKQKSSIGIGEAIATVNGEIVAKGELTFAVV